MSTNILVDGFAHHTWANLRVIDACASLTAEQLATVVPGTYGSIIDTLRHTVGADTSYLNLLTGGQVVTVDDESLAFDELGPLNSACGQAWQAFVSTHPDLDRVVVRHRDDGSESRAPAGLRLLQALQHGIDHRSQIATALTTLGVTPPDIDVWAWGLEQSRLEITEPTVAT
jgi:uncharacterized damage-inducible protein DinB